MGLGRKTGRVRGRKVENLAKSGLKSGLLDMRRQFKFSTPGTGGFFKQEGAIPKSSKFLSIKTRTRTCFILQPTWLRGWSQTTHHEFRRRTGKKSQASRQTTEIGHDTNNHTKDDHRHDDDCRRGQSTSSFHKDPPHSKTTRQYSHSHPHHPHHPCR